MHPTSTTPCWYTVENFREIESPALLVYPDRLEENIRRMVRLVGDPDRLRPHLKTVKMPEAVVMLLEQGIRRFKCATIAEAEMAGTCTNPILAPGPNSATRRSRR